MQELIRTSVVSIGENKGSPRIWQEGKYLEKAAFNQGCRIRITYREDSILVNLDKQGDHVISRKKSVPLLDINNKKIAEVFDTTKKVQIIVRIAEILIKRTYRDDKISKRRTDGTHADIFGGGGTLSVAAEKAGYKTKWAIEINKDYADIYQLNHEGVMYNSPISEIDFDSLEPVELLTAGIPCEPFSIARQNQKDKEFHENANLSLYVLITIERTNPRTIILEEVPAFAKSQIGMALIEAIKELGYNVECKELCGTDFGELALRKRVAIVCTTDTKPVFPQNTQQVRKVSEILLDPEDPECKWWNRETKGWVFDHWEKQAAKGNNFQSAQITGDSEFVPAITKRYFAQQGSNPVVKHPTKEGTFRWFTLTEVKRLQGLPDDYNLGETLTIAGEVMGQGVLVNVFQKVMEANKK